MPAFCFLDDRQDARGVLVGAGFDHNHRTLTGSMVNE
jgi:hypothetical protein